ncbi:unnamed protein product [Durusdinium trenchii]|uniref:AB hydrolase-1 domain-containing protein n=1 Tax=Durusdinium trenchii TaxID=1381693 RepID=A0ABP0L3C9_9DINO
MGRTLCLLLHANGLCKNVWRPFAASLARQLKVDLKLQSNRRQEVLSWSVGDLQLLSLDLKGHGLAAARSSKEVDWMEWKRQVEEVLDDFVAEMPEAPDKIVGVGHSLGGAALLLTQAARSRFSSIYIFEPMYLFVEEKLASMVGLPIINSERWVPPLVEKTLRRRSLWANRQEAELDLSSKRFFAAWDEGARQGYFEGGLIGDQPTRLACSPVDEAAVFSSGVPVQLLEELRKPNGLESCFLHVTIGQKETLWNLPVAQEIFGGGGKPHVAC